jgi:hypothetical protein
MSRTNRISLGSGHPAKELKERLVRESIGRNRAILEGLSDL